MYILTMILSMIMLFSHAYSQALLRKMFFKLKCDIKVPQTTQVLEESITQVRMKYIDSYINIYKLSGYQESFMFEKIQQNTLYEMNRNNWKLTSLWNDAAIPYRPNKMGIFSKTIQNTPVTSTVCIMHTSIGIYVVEYIVPTSQFKKDFYLNILKTFQTRT